MYKELRFVQGAIAKKDLIPAMKHFCIENGVIRSYNGALGLSSPIAVDIDCKPHAEQLVKAIGNCNPDHPVTVSMTPNGRLSIKNGPYRVLIDCIDEETPHVYPEGDIVYFDGAAVRRAFEMLLPFIGNDASRQWTNGVLLHSKSAFATNNVIVCQFWLGTEIPFTVNVPSATIKEFLRIGEDPTHAQLTENSITFHFPDGRWIRSGLYDANNWADAVIERVFALPAKPVPLPEGFFDGIKSLKPFTDKLDQLYFRDGAVRTHTESELGASYDMIDFPYEGCYTLPMLEMLDGIIKTIDFSMYPQPCIFYGDNLRGAIIGRVYNRAT